MIARILTPWTGDGKSTLTGLRPKLLEDHPLPDGVSCSDVTGQPAANLPPSPNLYTVELHGVSQAYLDAIAADASYQVIWSNP
jgi:hypothetical protein